MTEEKTAALMAAIAELKDKKVTAVKIECEAQMNRNWDEADCYNWLMQRIAEKTNTEYQGSDIDSYDDAEEYNPFDWMSYAQFYNDHSVDSELTFTVPINDERNVLHIPAVLEAFKELSRVAGSSFAVNGAGMHMAVLFSKDASYPHEEDDYRKVDAHNSHRLHATKIANFKRAVTQLLPALYFLSSSNENSRGLRYRMPQISMDYRRDPYGNNKYSAISYRYGAIEFRVFDTCYDSPLTVHDNLIVMANCIKYLKMTYESPGIDKVCKQIMFGTDGNDTLARFYTTISHLDVLDAGLELIKPSYYTLEQVKSQRKFVTDRTSLLNSERIATEEARERYKEYCERFEWDMKYREVQIRSNLMNELLAKKSLPQLRLLTYKQLEQEVEDTVTRQLNDYKNTKTSEADYIRAAVERAASSNSPGRYTISFA